VEFTGKIVCIKFNVRCLCLGSFAIIELILHKVPRIVSFVHCPMKVHFHCIQEATQISCLILQNSATGKKGCKEELISTVNLISFIYTISYSTLIHPIFILILLLLLLVILPSYN
jgi:hypothetical protein